MSSFLSTKLARATDRLRSPRSLRATLAVCRIPRLRLMIRAVTASSGPP